MREMNWKESKHGWHFPSLTRTWIRSFFHYDGKDIPVIEEKNYTLRVIAGEFRGISSPVKVYSDLFYVDFEVKDKSNDNQLTVDWGIFKNRELGIYVSKGSLVVDGEKVKMGQFVFFSPGENVKWDMAQGSRYVVLGGEPFPEKRNLFWNFVSASQDKIESAKKLWQDDGFPKVPNETDRIPLPG